MARRNVSPGEILLEEFLKPMGLSQRQLAKCMNVTPSWISDIIHERRDVTPKMAIMLGKAFGTTPEFWLNLQNLWSLEKLQGETFAVTPVRELV